MTRLAARDVTVTRGKRRILEGVTVSAGAGEFIALIGPNGAGKSTLLAVLAGLATPDQGEVLLDERPLAAWPPRELARHRAFLPQGARAEWPIAVQRLVGLGLTPSLPVVGDFSAADQGRIAAALRGCDLWDRREQAVTTLSGGELARAMLARALVSDPKLLIVDEPLAGLDPRHAHDALQRLRQLALEQGRLVIASVHDLNIALRCASRVWALKEGRLLADGPPHAVISGVVLSGLFGVTAELRGEGARTYVDLGP